MTDAIRIRRATTADAALLARHRAGMFVDMGALAAGSDEERTIVRETTRLLADAIPSGEWTAWVAEDDAGPLGGGAAVVRRLWPRPKSATGGETAYLLNFYVEPRARRRGAATALMRECLAWCRARRVGRVELHASAAGRRVYEKLGFVPREGEMIWDEAAAARISS